MSNFDEANVADTAILDALAGTENGMTLDEIVGGIAVDVPKTVVARRLARMRPAGVVTQLDVPGRGATYYLVNLKAFQEETEVYHVPPRVEGHGGAMLLTSTSKGVGPVCRLNGDGLLEVDLPAFTHTAIDGATNSIAGQKTVWNEELVRGFLRFLTGTYPALIKLRQFKE